MTVHPAARFVATLDQRDDERVDQFVARHADRRLLVVGLPADRLAEVASRHPHVHLAVSDEAAAILPKGIATVTVSGESLATAEVFDALIDVGSGLPTAELSRVAREVEVSDEPDVSAARLAVATLLSELDIARRQLAAATAEVLALRAAQQRLLDLEQQNSTMNEAQLELVTVRQRNQELLNILDQMYRSTSWKVTKPMRKLVDVARSTAVDAVRQVRGH